jgi:UDP-glucuronate 4-epimerase
LRQKKQILVTGAAGFIGYKVCQVLLDNGYGVVGVDNMNDYYDVRLKEYHLGNIKGENFVFYREDIEKIESIEPVFWKHKISAVINLAARAGVRYSSVNPYVYAATNVMGTLNLFELMKKYGINKMVLASSSSLYAGQKMPFREDRGVEHPVSVYAATKKSAELLASTYHYLYDIDVSVVRYFTVYGPAGRPDMAVFKFTQKIFRGEPIDIYGDGSQKRDFTYVDDIARGTVMALKKLGYEIVNLGAGMGTTTILDLIRIIERYSKKKAEVRFVPSFKEDMEATWADNTKAKELLGWKPEVSFEDGMRKFVEWYASNQVWLNTLEVWG